MAFGLFEAVGALEEFRGMPHHDTAVREVYSAASHMKGLPLRREVRRITRAFKDYRAEVAFCGEVW